MRIAATYYVQPKNILHTARQHTNYNTTTYYIQHKHPTTYNATTHYVQRITTYNAATTYYVQRNNTLRTTQQHNILNTTT